VSFIRAHKLQKIYGSGNVAVNAVHDISFEIESGEFVAVMGESGAGKSTLLDMIGAMSAPSSGQFWVDDIDIYAMPSEKRADFRREFLGFVFQSFYLVSYLTVLENVMLPLTTTGLGKKNKREMAQEALAWVGLDQKVHRMPNQISGGEKERVAIARAIVNDPPILLADEPTGNLDTKTSREIVKLLCRLNERGMTIIMVTHNPDCANSAKRRLTISDGILVHDTRQGYSHFTEIVSPSLGTNALNFSLMR
jgi:putative ABC transport system ATP-binding protein